MNQININVVIRIIKNQNLILTNGFHVDILIVVFDWLVVKSLNIKIDSRKRFLIVNRDAIFISSKYSCNDNFFVDVESIADRLNQSHHKYHQFNKKITTLIIII